MTPFLSIVLTGRNDDHGGDFTPRFLRALAFNHDRLRARGVSHEIVLVEWAPPSERPRLTDLVRASVPAIGSVLTSFLVDPRYHDTCSLNPRVRYLEFLAKNVGIRRAQGRAILSTNSDIFLGRGVVDALARETVEPMTVYRATRTDVKLGADVSLVDWDLLEDPRNHTTYKTIQPPLYAGGTGDFILMDRESFHALRGFNEIYRLVRIGLDVNLLVKAYSSGYRIVDIGSAVYHTSHVGSYRVAKHATSEDATDTNWGARWPARSIVYDNPESWGLRDAPLRQIDERTTMLDFSWAAVPPLVDLRRLVLPAARVGQPALDDTIDDTTPGAPAPAEP